MTTLTMRIKGYDLPGLEFCGSVTGGATRQQVHVGIQRGREAVGLVPGDAASALFEFELEVVQGRGSGLDFRVQDQAAVAGMASKG